MDKKHTSLKFKAKIKPLEKINDEFTLCKCYVQGIGKNRNYSYMSKENIQRCLPTLSYAPVVGHLIDKLDDYDKHIQQLIQEATDLLNSGENMADMEQYIKDVFDNTTKE